METNNNSMATAIICIAIFVGVIFTMYFLSKILIGIGGVVAIISVILLIVGITNKSSDLVLIGLIGLVVGIILLAVGLTGVNFFEQNPTGKNLLGASNTIVDTTKQAYTSVNTVK